MAYFDCSIALVDCWSGRLEHVVEIAFGISQCPRGHILQEPLGYKSTQGHSRSRSEGAASHCLSNTRAKEYKQ
jgi:hypothetical protein